MTKDQTEQLEDIKKLLILQLLNSGINGTTIAELLGMDQGDFSRAFPVRKLVRRVQE